MEDVKGQVVVTFVGWCVLLSLQADLADMGCSSVVVDVTMKVE